MVDDPPHSPAAPVPPRLTPRERSEIEAEAKHLIAKLKQRLADPGCAGVPHAVFVEGWDGQRLCPPSVPTSPTVSAAALAKIDVEMDAAFDRNVAMAKAEREARQAALPRGTDRVASDADHERISRQMDAAFERHVKRDLEIRERRQAEREARRPKTPGHKTAAPTKRAERAERPTSGPLPLAGRTREEITRLVGERMLENLRKADEKDAATRKSETPMKTALWRAVKAANPEGTDEEVDAAIAQAVAIERDLVLNHGLNLDQAREIAREELFPPRDDEA
jgi:hypothetical protein